MKPLLAYAVTEHSEGVGAIYFAQHAIAARKRGANEHGYGELSDVTCRRAPWADWCADSGIVPASLMIDHGWRFECQGCAEIIDEDFLAESDLTTDDVIGTQNGPIFCCPRCKADHDRIEAEKKRVANNFLDGMRAYVVWRFGEVALCDGDGWKPYTFVVHDNGSCSVNSAQLYFDFPGQKIGPASAGYEFCLAGGGRADGPPEVVIKVCAGDREAFEKFAEETRHAG